MRQVFVDTSGFYACLDGTDPFHGAALTAFVTAEAEGWNLATTTYVVHETCALVQRRLGWDAVEAFLNDLLPRCTLRFVDRELHLAGEARFRTVRERRFSLTDAVSLECMSQLGITEAIAQDEHFARAGITMPLAKR
jgi:uncharacterized protein